MLAGDHTITQRCEARDSRNAEQEDVSSQGTLTREHINMQDMLTAEHARHVGTLAREHVSTQKTLTCKHAMHVSA